MIPDDIDVKELTSEQPPEARLDWVKQNLYWNEGLNAWEIPGTAYSIYEKGTIQHANHVAMLRMFPWLEENDVETHHALFLEPDKIEWMPLWNHFKRICAKAAVDKIIDRDAMEQVSEEAIERVWRQGYAKQFADILADHFAGQLKAANPLKEIEDFVLSPAGLAYFNSRASDVEEYWNTEGKTPTINVESVAEPITLDDLRRTMYPEKGQGLLKLPGEISNTGQGELVFEADAETGEDELSSFMRQMKLADPAQVRAFMDEHFDYDDYHGMWEIVGFSDYSGSAVERANARYFQAKYPGIISVGHGGFNTEMYGVKEQDFEKIDAALLDALYKDLNRMQNYPVLDDELHSEVEEEKKEEAWDHWIKKEFRKELDQAFPQYEAYFDQGEFDGRLRQLFEMARDRGGAEWFEESGATQTIHLKDVLNGVNDQLIQEWIAPEQEAAQGQFALEAKRTLSLFHGTSSNVLDEVKTVGLRKPYLVDDPEIAMYYAQAAVDEVGGHPMVLRVEVRNTSKLRADYPSFEEPLTFVYKKFASSEEEFHEKLDDPNSGIRWPANEKDWQTSYKVVGSVRYDGTIGPGDISFDLPESLMESHRFSCLMAEAPEQLAAKVIEWGKMFITDDKVYIDPEDPEDFGREDRPHVTVKFGLHSPVPCDKLLQIIEETQPFEIGLGSCSLFDTNDAFDVVKFDVESDALLAFNERVSQLKNSDSHPEYRPHMTVAYVQKGTCEELTGKPLLPSDIAADFRFLVKAVVFSGPNGTRHTLFLGKPNLEEAVVEPERADVERLIQAALTQIAQAKQDYAKTDNWNQALQNFSTDELVLMDTGAPGAAYNAPSDRVKLSLPLGFVSDTNFENNLRRLITHELVHQGQYRHIKPEKAIEILDKKYAARLKNKDKGWGASLTAYYNDTHEVMAHARNYVHELLASTGNNLNLILNKIKTGKEQTEAYLYLTPKNRRRYRAYAYQYATQLVGS